METKMSFRWKGEETSDLNEFGTYVVKLLERLGWEQVFIGKPWVKKYLEKKGIDVES